MKKRSNKIHCKQKEELTRAMLSSRASSMLDRSGKATMTGALGVFLEVVLLLVVELFLVLELDLLDFLDLGSSGTAATSTRAGGSTERGLSGVGDFATTGASRVISGSSLVFDFLELFFFFFSSSPAPVDSFLDFFDFLDSFLACKASTRRR